MANIKITDVKIADMQEGYDFESIYILWNVETKRASNNKYYLDFTFRDETGEVSGKKWDASANEGEYIKSGKLYCVKGHAVVFQGAIQLNIFEYKIAPLEMQQKIGDYVPSAPVSSEEMMKTVYQYCDKVKDEDLKKLVYSVYKEYEKEVMYYPAAKALHHSIRGGYLYHVTTMLKVGEALSGIYNSVNTDYLYTGILIHDIMKLKEMNSNEFGIAEYSDKGQLMGHIELGISYIDARAKELGIPEKKTMLLEHMILSHHYEPEYGSSKMPMFLEAELLHHIDLIDARVYDFNKVYESLEKGRFTEKQVFSLERKVLKPDFE
ncbi:MAG: HD domain-containing protein [Clostridia bacterium]|jgi:3'-5' exoribonuclease